MEFARLAGGRYEVGRLLRKDGLAEVHEGRDRLLAQHVTITLLSSSYGGDRPLLGSFHRAARAAAELAHPNAVVVHATGFHEGLPFVVTEFLRGRSLQQALDLDGPLDIDRAAMVTRHVAAALQAAHEREVVHGDLSPRSVMLLWDGQVKVRDFAIAGVLASRAGGAVPSGDSAVRDDLWGLGRCLYQMLTGIMVPAGVEPVPPRALRPEVPAGLERVCLQALSRRPEGRYASAAELRADLDRALGEPPDEGGAAVDADAPTEQLPRLRAAPAPERRRRVARLRPPALRPWQVVGAAVLLVAVLLVALPRTVGGGLSPRAAPQPVTVPNESGLGDAASSTRPPPSTTAPEPTNERAVATTTTPPTASSASTASTAPPTSGPTSTPPPTTVPPPQMVTVPDVEGRRSGSAEALLRSRGFQVRRETEPDLFRDDIVLRQDPEGDARAPEGSTVTIVVGDGL